MRMRSSANSRSATCMSAHTGVPEPKLSEPVDLNSVVPKPGHPVSAHFLKQAQERRQDKKPAAKYSLKDKADLDAIGQEE